MVIYVYNCVKQKERLFSTFGSDTTTRIRVPEVMTQCLRKKYCYYTLSAAVTRYFQFPIIVQ